MGVNLTGKSLVEIVSQFSDLERQLVDACGDLTPEMEQMLVLNDQDLRIKVDAYRAIMDRLKAEIKYQLDIENEHKAARQTLENRLKWLVDNLKFNMNSMDRRELEGYRYIFKLSVRKPTLQIDTKLLPPEYLKEVIYKEPDKEAIEANLAMGAVIPGAEMKPVLVLNQQLNKISLAKPVEETNVK